MELNVEQIVREYIDKTVHMSLATTVANRPWVSELHFSYDENLNIYFISLSERRHSREIATNPKVAGSIIDKYLLGETPVGIFFEGNAKLLEPGEEQNIAATCLKERLKFYQDLVAESKLEDGHKIYKITVDTWSVFGRFGGESSQKYKLVWNGGNN